LVECKTVNFEVASSSLATGGYISKINPY
jgi:hypothetical protein